MYNYNAENIKMWTDKLRTKGIWSTELNVRVVTVRRNEIFSEFIRNVDLVCSKAGVTVIYSQAGLAAA